MPPPKGLKEAVTSSRGGAPAQARREQRANASRAFAGREFDSYTLPMIIDKVLAAPATGGSCEPMCQALLALRDRVASDASNVPKVGSKLAERSSAWAAFLSRVANDEHNRLRRLTISAISWLMVQLVPLAAAEPTYQLFILNPKFLQLLTFVTEAPVVEIAQTILHCCQSQRVIETVVKNSEMPTILRVAIERLAQLGPQYLDACTAMVMLAANLVGRHPSVAADMVDGRIDELLCQVGLRNISNLSMQMGIVTQRAVLYCLRFFVRIRRESIPFCESCLSMCAHSIKALPNESTDLCGDVCAVMNNPVAVARSHPNVYLNVVALATRMPNMSRAHFVFRLLKGLLPATDASQVAFYAEYGLAAAMKLCRIGWLDPDPQPNPATYRKEAVSELLDLLVVCIQFGQREKLAARINASVMAALKNCVVATMRDNLGHLTKFVKVQMFFSLPVPATGLCKFWIPLSPLIESGDLSIADYNTSHPDVAPFNPATTIPAEQCMQDYLSGILFELGHFESRETAARYAVRESYVAAINLLIQTVMAERVEILNSKSEVAFRLVDSAARTRLLEMRAVVDEEHQRFRSERVLEMTHLRHQILARHDAVMRLAADFARSETEDAQLPPHELADMRIYHRKVMDRVRRNLKAEREAQLSEVRWHAGQGNHLRHLLREFLVEPSYVTSLSHVQVQEEIVRGYGWYHMVRYRADEEAAESVGVGGGAATNNTNSVMALASPAARNGLQSASSGAAPSMGSMGRPADSARSSVSAASRGEFEGIMPMPVLPAGTSETYVSIVEEEENAWHVLRSEIEQAIARSRRTTGQREDVTDALEYLEEVERFIIQEDNWRQYMVMREELEYDSILEQWRTGVPLTVEELEQRNRSTIEDKASRWLQATMGLVSILGEEEARRAFIKTTIYNAKVWAERYELLGRATIEVDECRHFHTLLVQWKERNMRALLFRAEQMEREVLEEVIAFGPGVPVELLMSDARLEPDLGLPDMDPFAWPSLARDITYRRPSSFYGHILPDRIRRSGSSRSLSLVSDSFRASATAAAGAIMREDTDMRPSDTREKRKRQQQAADR